ncbi:hypothetical protein ACSS6W_007381 [Trichoderma asperelloides]
MADSDTGVFGAVGAVLGYVGAEAATGQIFEPPTVLCECYTEIDPYAGRFDAHEWAAAHHSAQSPRCHICSWLIQGGRVGHMLGTAFCPDQDWTCTSWTSNGQKMKTEPVRNCLWVRALSYVPIPILSSDTQQATDQTPEKIDPRPDQIRAKVAVSHLTLTRATKQDVESKMPFVEADVGKPASLWALWWLAPLLLRLISGLFAVDRKSLEPLELASLNEDIWDYEIHCPQYEGNFMLLTGPKSVVQQFFVHYGHPERNRFREAVQIAMVVLFGLLFPLGLFFSVIWMPIAVQKIWVCYQFYSGLAMIVLRYTHGCSDTSTEAMIAEHFKKQQESVPITDDGKQETAILFGATRDGSETIKASFVPAYHNRFLDDEHAWISFYDATYILADGNLMV